MRQEMHGNNLCNPGQSVNLFQPRSWFHPVQSRCAPWKNSAKGILSLLASVSRANSSSGLGTLHWEGTRRLATSSNLINFTCRL